MHIPHGMQVYTNGNTRWSLIRRKSLRPIYCNRVAVFELGRNASGICGQNLVIGRNDQYCGRGEGDAAQAFGSDVLQAHRFIHRDFQEVRYISLGMSVPGKNETRRSKGKTSHEEKSSETTQPATGGSFAAGCSSCHVH